MSMKLCIYLSEEKFKKQIFCAVQIHIVKYSWSKEKIFHASKCANFDIDIELFFQHCLIFSLQSSILGHIFNKLWYSHFREKNRFSHTRFWKVFWSRIKICSEKRVTKNKKLLITKIYPCFCAVKNARFLKKYALKRGNFILCG